VFSDYSSAWILRIPIPAAANFSGTVAPHGVASTRKRRVSGMQRIFFAKPTSQRVTLIKISSQHHPHDFGAWVRCATMHHFFLDFIFY